MLFSIITPIYQCSSETKEFLESLIFQEYKDFEIIFVEDGDLDSSKEIINSYKDTLDINYFFKKNTSVSFRRNFGMSVAKGDYFVFFDSDCIIPKEYFNVVLKEINNRKIEAWGGPDKDHDTFSVLQKAINYSMTSFFTTGGIRGGKKKISKYHPRSFNMGISREVYEKTGGFPTVFSPGEDIIFSINIQDHLFITELIQDAFVYHKRKVSIKKFFKQISAFAFVRYPISLIYPHTRSIVFLFPSIYLVGLIGLLLAAVFIHPVFILPLIAHYLLIFIDAFLKTKKIKIAGLSVLTSLIQFIAYGFGYIKSGLMRIYLGKSRFFKKYGYSKIG